jgi:hypothetical protein
MNDARKPTLKDIATEVASLVEDKSRQYGDSVGKTGDILTALYPTGIRPDQYNALLLVVRMLDKISRLANQGPDGRDKGGESPYRDIIGYGLLGLRNES